MDYQSDWQATRYFLSDKMYAMIGGDKNGAPIVTMKCDPVFAEMLRKTKEFTGAFADSPDRKIVGHNLFTFKDIK